MRKRYGMSRNSSQRKFTKGAMRVHQRNVPRQAFVMRGGIRL